MDDCQRTYSTTEVCDMLDVSYRMADYWLRRRFVVIESDVAGSGHRRRWTLNEVEALRRCLRRTAAAQRIIDKFTSGEMWRAETQREPS